MTNDGETTERRDDTRRDVQPRPRPRLQLSVKQMMAMASIFCLAFALYYWIGPLYATVAIVPLAMVIPMWVADPRTVLGAMIGMLASWLLAEYLLIGWSKLEWQYYASQLAVSMYAAAFGAGIHAIRRGRPLVGSLLSIAAGLAFVVMLVMILFSPV